MKKNIILGILGLTLFFLVMSVLYSILVYTQGEPEVLVPFIPLIVFSGFFIFLIGAIFIALSISRMINIR